MQRTFWIFGLLALGWMTAASGQQPAITSQTSDPRPTFSKQVAAIIYEKCSACHRPGQVGPFPLLTYDDVLRHAETIKIVVNDNYMPPWKPANHIPGYANDRSLNATQKGLVLDWIESGCPLGDANRVPPVPTFPGEWNLGKPDLVVPMKGQFKIPADGPDVYRSFVFPLELPEDKWVKAVELRSNANSAMHHALFFLDDSGSARNQDGADGQAGFAGMGFLAFGAAVGPSEDDGNLLSRLRSFRKAEGNTVDRRRIDEALSRGLGGYVPGTIPTKLPGDLAMALPRGSDIVMQTHFHPSGKPEIEHAELGLYLADAPPTRQLINIQLPPLFGFGAGIDIPAGEKNFRIAEQMTLPIDVQAVAVGGHAHYICRTMQMTAQLPSGQIVELLRIDDWDLDWQDRYIFSEQIPLPKGTVLRSEIRYDNSSDNPENPYSPPRRIRWGRQSNDEMGSITLSVIAQDERERPILVDRLRDHFSKTVVSNSLSGAGLERMLQQLDEDRDGKLQRNEAPPRLSGAVFQLLDKDKDGALDSRELKELKGLIETIRGSKEGNAP